MSNRTFSLPKSHTWLLNDLDENPFLCSLVLQLQNAKAASQCLLNMLLDDAFSSKLFFETISSGRIVFENDITIDFERLEVDQTKYANDEMYRQLVNIVTDFQRSDRVERMVDMVLSNFLYRDNKDNTDLPSLASATFIKSVTPLFELDESERLKRVFSMLNTAKNQTSKRGPKPSDVIEIGSVSLPDHLQVATPTLAEALKKANSYEPNIVGEVLFENLPYFEHINDIYSIPGEPLPNLAKANGNLNREAVYSRFKVDRKDITDEEGKFALESRKMSLHMLAMQISREPIKGRHLASFIRSFDLKAIKTSALFGLGSVQLTNIKKDSAADDLLSPPTALLLRAYVRWPHLMHVDLLPDADIKGISEHIGNIKDRLGLYAGMNRQAGQRWLRSEKATSATNKASDKPRLKNNALLKVLQQIIVEGNLTVYIEDIMYVEANLRGITPFEDGSWPK